MRTLICNTIEYERIVQTIEYVYDTRIPRRNSLYPEYTLLCFRRQAIHPDALTLQRHWCLIPVNSIY